MKKGAIRPLFSIAKGLRITYKGYIERNKADGNKAMMNLIETAAYFKDFGGMNDKGMETEWHLFLEETGKKAGYTRNEVLVWLGY